MSATEVIADAMFDAYQYDKNGADAKDILDALEAAGYAVVELPKPEGESPDSWLDCSVTATRGLGRVRLYQDDHRLMSTDAREIAAALLAAADTADAAEPEPESDPVDTEISARGIRLERERRKMPQEREWS